MEILILGLLLVAAMVFISTRIKRAAAEAYNEESVETDDFKLEKPSGFMYPFNAETEFPYEAYSKEFGDRGTRNIWRARTRLRLSEGLNVRSIINEARESETGLSEKKMEDLPENQVGSILRSYKTEDEVDYRILRKIVADKKRNRTWELRTTILEPFEDEFTDPVCEMMKSFELK